MKNIGILVCLSVVFAFTSCKNETKNADTEIEKEVEIVKDVEKEIEEVKSIEFNLESKSETQATGRVAFMEKNGVVSFKANLEGLSPGMHAIHIHEKADCSSADGKSTGGHWNPTFAQHGKWGDSNGYHKGDIGNFEADADGNGSISMQTDEWCIGCGDEEKDIMGKAIIVHQGKDDFVTQPTGDAGGRVSCGGIIE